MAATPNLSEDRAALGRLTIGKGEGAHGDNQELCVAYERNAALDRIATISSTTREVGPSDCRGPICVPVRVVGICDDQPAAYIPAEVEIRNEARVYLWYEQKSGKPCPAHRSTEDAIDSFAATTCCRGVCPNNLAGDGVCTPLTGFGRVQPHRPPQSGPRAAHCLRGQGQPLAPTVARIDRHALADIGTHISSNLINADKFRQNAIWQSAVVPTVGHWL